MDSFTYTTAHDENGAFLTFLSKVHPGKEPLVLCVDEFKSGKEMRSEAEQWAKEAAQ